MKRFIAFLLLCLSYNLASAQEGEDEFRGTIKVQKTGHINRIIFDNVNYRLIAIDQYGNPLDSAIQEFQLGVSIKGIYYKEQTKGSILSYQMQQLLGKCDQTSVIFFDKIKAKDRSGTVLDMPKFSYSLGKMSEDY